MPVSLILLIALLVAAFTVAVWVHQTNRQRRELLSRADGRTFAAQASVIALTGPDVGWRARLAGWLRRNAPAAWSEPGKNGDILVHAGFDGVAAPVVYTTIRLAAAVLPPLLVFAFGPHDRPARLLLYIVCALVLGLLAPSGLLAR